MGMRTDALGAILRETAADLLLVSSQGPIVSFLGGPAVGPEDVERELVVLAELHPEYGELSVIPLDGRPAIHIVRSVSNAEPSVAHAGDSATELAVGPALLHAGGDVFVLLVRPAASQHGSPSAQSSALALLVGVGVEDDSGELKMAVTAQLPWTDVLDQYAHAHPGSVSLAFLRTYADGQTFFAGSASDKTDEAILSVAGVSDTAQTPLPPSLALTERGQAEIGGGLLTYDTFRPEDVARGTPAAAPANAQDTESTSLELAWKAISWVPPSTLDQVKFAGALDLIAWNAFGVAAMGLISWFSADRLARRNALHRRTAAERSVLSSAFGRYVPKIEAESLLTDPRRYADLGGTAHEAAILFADIRGFTRFAELHEPQLVVGTLNKALGALIPSMHRHGGVLDKYLGDGFLAFFLPSANSTDAAQRATDAACEMQKAFAELQHSEPGRDLEGMGLGIGISSGRVVLGNVGSEDLMDFTVIGDNVNVAARLQAAAAAGEVLITESAFRTVVAVDGAERRLEIELRGRHAPVAVRVITNPSWIGPARL